MAQLQHGRLAANQPEGWSFQATDHQDVAAPVAVGLHRLSGL